MIAYFDCASGISGDMFLGALVDAGLAIEKLSAAVEAIPVEGLRLEAARVTRLGIAATKISVHAPHEHVHRNLSDIEGLIDRSALSPNVKATAARIFARLAAAEAKAHGRPVDEVHFHEVGAADSIADIVGAAAALELMGIDKCYFSPVPVGSGTVKTAHGVLPVPAPATAELLVGVPLGESLETGELTTPTGAAIVKELAAGFGTLPAMRVTAVGSGAGSREGRSIPNVLRVFVGELSGDATPQSVTVIETAIDDMTPEAISYAQEALFSAGALDVYVTAILMKKGRPGHLLTILADEAKKDAVLDAVFRETTTFGVRVSPWQRETLERETIEAKCEYGTFRVKVGRYRGKAVSATPEYEDAKRIAQRENIAFREVYSRLQAEAAGHLDASKKL